MYRRTLVVVAALGAAGSCGAGTWFVEEGESIQAAVEAAADGDRVLVGPGVYNESIDLLGKAITLQSADGPRFTILDGTDLEAGIITCVSGETAETVIRGFTVTGATGRVYQDEDSVGSALLIDGSGPSVQECWFRLNRAMFGGAVYANDGGPIFKHCVFEDNKGQVGGAIYGFVTHFDLRECVISANVGGLGGAIYADYGCQLELSDCSVERNVSNTNGGAIRCSQTHMTLRRCRFEDNSAGRRGGAVHCSSVVITECHFEGNVAEGSGGAVWGSIAARACRFFNNTSGYKGGRCYANDDSAIASSLFVGNTGRYGGGVYSGSRLAVAECDFRGNRAYLGGGIYSFFGPSVSVVGCTFADNSAVQGGGVRAHSLLGAHEIRDCRFRANRADELGGGVALTVNPYGGSSFLLSRCTITDNTAYFGGGVFLSGTPELHGCLIDGNRAVMGGGVAAGNSALPVIVNCTIVGNDARAGAALSLLQESAPWIANTILWSNGTDPASSIDGSEGGVATFGSSLVQGSGGSAAWLDDFGVDAGGNLDLDPLLVDIGAGDSRLGPGSPCIDAGDNEAVPLTLTLDLDGRPRFIDDPATRDTGVGRRPIVDMGGYEFPGWPRSSFGR